MTPVAMRGFGRAGLDRRQAILALLAGGTIAARSTGAWGAGAAPAFVDTPDIVVAQDGSGDFRSVQAALQSIPRDNAQRKVVLVRDGVYQEHVRVDAAYVTLRGQSRLGARIAFDRPASAPKDDIGQAVLNIAPTAHDLVVENLTVHNTVEAIGPHAFAVLGRADRTIIQNAEVLSRGADTLALWRQGPSAAEAELSRGPGATPLSQGGGRYYHRDLHVTGSVDFICPRGWCYMTDSRIEQLNPKAEAAFWLDGSGDPAKKFVIRRTHVDGPAGFRLARAHRDALFYFLDCVFAETLGDKAPYLVRYPIAGGAPSPADLQANAKIDAEVRAGVRAYFEACHRSGGDYPWLADNLVQAPGAPPSRDLTARWTFGGTWDPEDPQGPRALAVRRVGARLEVEFDRLVSVRGQPGLALRGGGLARYLGGGGSNTLAFEPASKERALAPTRLVYEHGAVVASEAMAAITLADPRIPAPSAGSDQR